MSTVLVIAPHPDDETLGCGGTLLRHQAEGDETHWLIITEMGKESECKEDQIKAREQEITAAIEQYQFDSVHQLGFMAARLDTVPRDELIRRIRAEVTEIGPHTIYLPFPGDVHSDHRIVFESAVACTKTFRNPTIRRVLSFETLSETDFAIDPTAVLFRPNLFVDISRYLDKKILIMKLFTSEMGPFPFPRSEEAIRALAARRGSQAGFEAAEAFMILKEIR